MRKIVSLIILAVLMVFASTVSAIPIGEVGFEDTLYAWTNDLSNSSLEAEEGWISGLLGPVTYTKLENSGGDDLGSAWDDVIGVGSDGLWAFDFGSANPDYFLIKTGNHVGLIGDSGPYKHYLYQNLASLQYGVINLNDFVRTNPGNVDIEMFSHVGITGGTPVPEPTTILLLGSGLIGLGLFKNKYRKK